MTYLKDGDCCPQYIIKMFSIADAQGMFSDNFFAVAFPGSIPVHAKLTTEKIHSENAAKNVFLRKINRYQFILVQF